MLKTDHPIFAIPICSKARKHENTAKISPFSPNFVPKSKIGTKQEICRQDAMKRDGREQPGANLCVRQTQTHRDINGHTHGNKLSNNSHKNYTKRKGHWDTPIATVRDRRRQSERDNYSILENQSQRHMVRPRERHLDWETTVTHNPDPHQTQTTHSTHTL